MMDALNFAYWLNGFAELNESPPTEAQWQAIKDHLALVFNKVTPLLADTDIMPGYPRSPSDASRPLWQISKVGWPTVATDPTTTC